jgi:hypothetical protein
VNLRGGGGSGRENGDQVADPIASGWLRPLMSGRSHPARPDLMTLLICMDGPTAPSQPTAQHSFSGKMVQPNLIPLNGCQATEMWADIDRFCTTKPVARNERRNSQDNTAGICISLNPESLRHKSAINIQKVRASLLTPAGAIYREQHARSGPANSMEHPPSSEANSCSVT